MDERDKNDAAKPSKFSSKSEVLMVLVHLILLERERQKAKHAQK